LGIDLKSNEKKILISTVGSICFVFLVAIFMAIFINSLSILFALKILLFLSIFSLFVAAIYTIVNYLLEPIFKANHLLDLLLKDTLHELNIPLSVINANLHMLRLDEKDNKKLQRLGRISLACIDLQRLYLDVDYYIKREVRFDLKEVFDIKDLVEQEIQKFQSQDLHVKIVSNVKSLHIRVDKHGLGKVLGNLISNSIKYNKNENMIKIELKNGRLGVTDNGIGMNESEVFKIFDRYYQGDSAKEGFGIGLSIVKAYCDEEKIIINISSKKDIGTEIVLDFKNVVTEKRSVNERFS